MSTARRFYRRSDAVSAWRLSDAKLLPKAVAPFIKFGGGEMTLSIGGGRFTGVKLGDWIVQAADGHLQVFSSERFAQLFVEVA